MSRWCDQSIHDERNPHFPVALYEVALLFGTLVAETILASVHVRAHRQAGHMDASDLIKALQTPCEEGVVHIWKIARSMSCTRLQLGHHSGELSASGVRSAWVCGLRYTMQKNGVRAKNRRSQHEWMSGS